MEQYAEKMFVFSSRNDVGTERFQFKEHAKAGKIKAIKKDGGVTYELDWPDDDRRFRMASNPLAIKLLTQDKMSFPKPGSLPLFGQFLKTVLSSDYGSGPAIAARSNILSELVDIPFDDRRSMSCFVFKLGSIICIVRNDEVKKKRKPAKQTKDGMKVTFKDAFLRTPGDANETMYSCISSLFGAFKVITFDKVDCLDDNGDPINVLLRKQQSHDEIRYHRYSLFKLWRDAQPTGVKRAIVGTRANGTMKSLVDLDIATLQSKASEFSGGDVAQKYTPWDGQKGVDFAYHLFEFLEQNVEQNSVFVLKRSPEQPDFVLSKVDSMANFIPKLQTDELTSKKVRDLASA
ncbi:hypothetical protein HDE_10067 [Halotydeus destructor]|nr:hypothetical protein HDE_10067 [Halotydeus destructor]